MKMALVRLRDAGQLTTYQIGDDIVIGDYVIVEADRGLDYGEIVEIASSTEAICDKACAQPCAKENTAKNILRKASPEDLKQITENKKEAKEAMKTCARKVREYKLPMKLVDAEYSFDRKKIIFYFTAEGRIDFRELVKDLAKVFKIRIEMRQIGVRDEARIFGGVGPCGQALCCVRFLKNFEAVSMKMAKTQRLPLTSGKISGICGRLMCCLFYEYKTYRDLSRGLPKDGQIIDTPAGKGKVLSVNVLKRLVNLEMEDGRVEKIVFPEEPPPAEHE
ncbi:MAG: stage 0 sporulation family protein [Candidatus Omnitrophica bacterium]|nr:stage 0 sporulation family protein [Candidatus Omnitrophota bacterium]